MLGWCNVEPMQNSAVTFLEYSRCDSVGYLARNSLIANILLSVLLFIIRTEPPAPEPNTWPIFPYFLNPSSANGVVLLEELERFDLDDFDDLEDLLPGLKKRFSSMNELLERAKWGRLWEPDSLSESFLSDLRDEDDPDLMLN